MYWRFLCAYRFWHSRHCSFAIMVFVIRSYRQLNTGKFATLTELEEQLPYQFFKREWELLEQGKSYKKYWKLTVVETGLSMIFLIMFVLILIRGDGI